MAKFSKQAMIDHLEKQMEFIVRRRGFKEGDGWAVVDGKDTEVVLDFGRFDELRDLIDDIYSGHL